MTRRQLFALFSNGLVSNTIGYAFGAIIPIYITRDFTDDASIIGAYLALSYLTYSIGMLIGGWFSDRYPHRRIRSLIILVVLRAFAFGLHGFVTEFPPLMFVSVFLFSMSGFTTAIISTIAGLYAGENERGMIFSIIWVNLAAGAFIGGLTSGSIVDSWGFEAFFILGALLTLLLQIPATLLIEDKPKRFDPPEHTMPSKYLGMGAWLRLERNYVLLFIASNLAYITPYIGLLGRPLLMESLGFDTSAITSTIAVSGAISLPFTLIVGSLSDRMGRLPLLAGCYVSNVIGMLLLAEAEFLWQYQLSAGLLLGVNASLGVGSALIADSVAPEMLGRALSLFTATAWIGGVIGSLGTGYAMELVGIYPTFLGGTILPVFAILFLIPIHMSRRKAGARVIIVE